MKAITIFFLALFFLSFQVSSQQLFWGTSEAFSIDTKDPVLSLQQPNGNEIFHYQDSIEVRWNASEINPAANPVSIAISTDYSGNYTFIEQGIPDNGSWFILAPQGSPYLAKIKIVFEDTFGNTWSDESDGYFLLDTIAGNGTSPGGIILDSKPPEMHVMKPNGGERYFPDAPFTIHLSASDDSFDENPLFIGISTEIGGTVQYFEEEIGLVSFIEETMPSDITDHAIIHIMATDTFGIPGIDTSDNYFSVALQPLVITDTVVWIWPNTALCPGHVIMENGPEILSKGICWSTLPEPNIGLPTVINEGPGPGDFECYPFNLNESTTYYVRAYATTISETIYGEERIFTTAGPMPLDVSTLPITLDEYCDVAGGGIVKSQGGSAVIQRGVCWDTSPIPNVNLTTKTLDGDGTGKFISIMENLTAGIDYYIRAYAINNTDTAYGEEKVYFYSIPLAETGGVSSVTTSSAILHGFANANTSTAYAEFEYGTTNAYGNTVAGIPYEITGNTSIEVLTDVEGLDIYTEYHYRLKVTKGNCAVYGDDSMFYSRAIIEITKPEAGDQWYIGRAYNIEWNNTGEPLVTLEYNIDDKPNWNLISHNVDIANGYYNWIVPDSMTTNCKIRMTDGIDYIYDVSESFEIYNPVVYNNVDFVFSEDPLNTFGYEENNPENAFEEGKRVRFKVLVQNRLGFNLLTIFGKIKSDCPWFTIIDDSATYNNVYSGGTRKSYDFYEIELAQELPSEYELYFTLTIYDEFSVEDPYTSYSDTILAIDPFEFSMLIIDDDKYPDSYGNNDGIVNEGEIIEIVPMINNTMEYNFSGVEGKLTCQHSGVEIWNCPDDCNPPNCPVECGVNFDVYDTYSYGYIENYQYTSGIPEYMVNARPERDYVFKFSGVQQTSIDFKIIITGSPDNITLVPGLDKWSVTFTLNNGYPPYIPYVWPGDANNDMQVDNRDLLPVGVHFGERGLPRDSVSIMWLGQTSDDWNRLQYNMMNLKFADCNGDSIIDFYDTLAISQNYGLTHLKSKPFLKSVETAPELHFVMKEENGTGFGWYEVEAWTGNLFNPVYDLYGIAFEINTDLSRIDPSTLKVSTAGSWLEVNEPGVLNLARVLDGGSTIECAVIRTDNTGKSGFGKVANITYKLKEGSYSVNDLLEFTGYEAVDPTGDQILFKVNNHTGKLPFDEGEGIISIFPNPSNDAFNVIISGTGSVNELSVINSQGNLVYQSTMSNDNPMAVFTINLRHFDKGIYFLRLVSEGQNQIRKLVLY